jgi:hypothetical protein
VLHYLKQNPHWRESNDIDPIKKEKVDGQKEADKEKRTELKKKIDGVVEKTKKVVEEVKNNIQH